jgi:hypothetical protein
MGPEYAAYQRSYFKNNPEKYKRAMLPEDKVKKRREYERLYRIKNIDKFRAREKDRDQKNKEKKRLRQKQRRLNPAWKAKHAERVRLLRASSPAQRILHSCRQRIRAALSQKKTETTLSLIGCSPAFLKEHLEKQFKAGMTWENYGKNGWHIDHKLPCASFDLENENERNKCFHYTNLQPLWALENILKKDKILQNL